MKKFIAKFESTDWCGYWDNFLVLAPDNFNEDMVEMHPRIADALADWLLESVHVDTIYVYDHETNEETDEIDYEAMDAERGSASVTFHEWLEEDDGYIDQYNVIDLR